MKKGQKITDHEGTILRDKFTSEDIFERILRVAQEEVSKGNRELLFSALAAGFAITLTFFMYASLTAQSYGNLFLGKLMYPLGFVFIVLGGYQLFTENTLPPVALVLDRLASVPLMLKVWLIVLAGNLLGGFLGSILLAFTGVFTPEAALAATDIASKVMQTSSSALFFRGMLAGLIVAGVVWLDYAMREGATRFFIVYFSFLAIPLSNLNHVVITATETFYLFWTQGLPLLPMLWHAVVPVLLGNAIGGVLLVTVVNYFQTPAFILKNIKKRLTVKEWLFSLKSIHE